MERLRQSVDEILNNLSVLESVWKDELAARTLRALGDLPTNRALMRSDLEMLLSTDFEVGITIIRLFLDRSKDELAYELSVLLGPDDPPTKKTFLRTPSGFLEALDRRGVLADMNHLIRTPVSWRDIISERLKSGRGSAIKGQHRGRALEDFVESIVRDVFGELYDVRTSFIGKDGQSTAKSDFAIPSKERPSILIEVKAFGATGSKQTNVIGDIQEIIDQKRHDTAFLFVTDGVTWQARKSDLRHIVGFQNAGDIYRIYTSRMGSELHKDLSELKQEYRL